MGFALAECFAESGAHVHLVSGPTAQQAIHTNIKVYPVTTADEMYAQALQLAPKADIWVFAAAVADYKPKVVSAVKVKKSEDSLTLELVKNVDIAKSLGEIKKENQFSVGFALETDNETINAQVKLQTKNLDMIVLNSLQDAGAGFRHDTNKISIIQKDKIVNFPLKTKAEVARDIVAFISDRIHV